LPPCLPFSLLASPSFHSAALAESLPPLPFLIVFPPFPLPAFLLLPHLHVSSSPASTWQRLDCSRTIRWLCKFISASATDVPFISASATDVQLTQGATRPFFMRTVASDGVQMAAMAGGDEACQIPGGDEACQMPELIKHYKWQQVALIYSDDRFGRNGVAALTSQLITIRAEADVAVRVAIPLSATDEAIHDYISSLVPLDVAVYVLHASATVFSTVVEAARKLRLYARSSVWIASDAAAAMSFTFNQHLDGLIITTTHLPSSPHLSSFLDRWKHLNASQYPGLSKEMPSPYALSSHDAVTLVARALHSLLYPSPPASTNSSSHALKQTQQRNISPQQQSISPQQERQQQKRVQQQAGPQQEGEGGAFQQLELPVLPSLPNGTQDALAPPLTRLQRSAIGPALRKALLKTSFDGLQGRIALTPHGDLAASEIRIFNIQKRAPMEVALWSSSLGLVPSSSRPPPQSAPPSTASPAPRPGPVAVPSTQCRCLPALFDRSNLCESVPLPPCCAAQTPNALPIIFPGGLTQVPTGSFPKTRLRIAVPNKQQYKEYVNVSDALGEGNSRFSGYCVEVFRLAITRLPYKLDYEFVLYGDKDLSYTQMVLAVANKTYDAAVGDITVLDSRSKFVFFTHPIQVPPTPSRVQFLTHHHSLIAALPSLSLSQQSGLGVMGFSRPYSNPWMVFSPFTASMWAVTAAICLTTGLLAMMLDRQRTPDFQGPLQTRLMTAVCAVQCIATGLPPSPAPPCCWTGSARTPGSQSTLQSCVMTDSRVVWLPHILLHSCVPHQNDARKGGRMYLAATGLHNSQLLRCQSHLHPHSAEVPSPNP
ncbi:unnamed protein product, partial [Closterium sp. NIES-65]